MPDDNVHADIVYLCSPNNPTGATYTVDQLKELSLIHISPWATIMPAPTASVLC